MNKNIVLASSSPRRKELLNQIGIEPLLVPSFLEENVTSDIPEQIVTELSMQKAEDVAGRCRNDSIVIGADTIVMVKGDIFGKPETEKEAAEMLRHIQGNVHQVYTGVTLISTVTNEKIVFVEKTNVGVYPMSEDEIMDYVYSSDGMDKAGAYGIQGRFAAYIEKIDGDYFNVVGLPVGRVYQELKKLLSQES